jgi:hypothetical protein
MAPSSSTTIPAFYRVFFPSIDPLIALSGIYFAYFQPAITVSSMFPLSQVNITPSHVMLLQQLGGCYISVSLLQIFLHRYTYDVGVWKLFQLSILISDIALLHSLWTALGAQERRGFGKMRAEEVGIVLVTAFVGLVRVLFLTGVGSGSKVVKKVEVAEEKGLGRSARSGSFMKGAKRAWNVDLD